MTHTAFYRYDLDALLPIVVQRLLAGDFTSKEDIGRAYGVHKDTVKQWRRRAEAMGLITGAAWRLSLQRARSAQRKARRYAPRLRAAMAA